jgi:hypothetical protein
MSPLFDPGLQPERTSLAWRRTVLALAVGSLVGLRLLPAAFGQPVWMLPGLLGLMVCGYLWTAIRRRQAATDAELGSEHSVARLPGAALPLTLALAVTSIGLVSVAVVALAGHAR